MSLIRGVHHIALKPTAANYDRVVSFYTELLGLPIVRSWGFETTRGVMISTGDGSLLEILSGGESDTLESGPFDHLAFYTENVDQLIEVVRSAGYKIDIEPKNLDIQSEPIYPVRIAFCIGPMNEMVEFFHPDHVHSDTYSKLT